MLEHENKSDQTTQTTNGEMAQKEQGVNYQQLFTQCEQKNSEIKDQLLRTTADFENYKKRIERERIQWINQTQAAILLDFLTVVDDFERAFKSDFSSGVVPTGIELIYKELLKKLEKYQVVVIQENQEFDPLLHEAILQVESEKFKTGHIVEVLQKGYRFKGELLRPAKVSVAK